MIILHFASLRNIGHNGVETVVPMYIDYQSRENLVGLINIKNEPIITNNIDISLYHGHKQLKYNTRFDLKDLEPPFDKPDIVVFQECYVVDFVTISRNIRKYNIPYVIIPHGELQKKAQQKSYLKKFIANNTYFRNFIKKSCGLICLSKGEMLETNFLVPKMIVENGVVLPSLVKQDFNNDKIMFSYIGRLDMRHKGIDLLLNSLALIQEQLRNYNCFVSIYGPDKDGSKLKIERLINKLDISDIVGVFPPVYNEDKIRTLLKSDVFLQTSRFEGMPMGVLEALSYGIPCLLTTGTNLGKEVERANAGWCAEINIDSIAENIFNAIKERTLYKIKGNNARRLIEKEYNWEKITNKTIDLYQSIIDRTQ